MPLALLFLLLAQTDWPSYGGDPGGMRHSSATQITPANVQKLAVAWTYKTRGLYQPKNGRPSALETTPLYVAGKLYLTSALGRVAALDPSTGRELWSFDPHIDPDKGYGDFTNRGVSWHSSGLILSVSVDARLFALDAQTGAKRWEVNLRQGLRNPPQGFADYEQTSPPAVIGNIVVVGSAVADNGSAYMPSGEVRGFAVKTGKLLWTWDPVPGEGKRRGGANAWSVIAADPARGLVFVPTGSPSPDYYGGLRQSPDHGNSLVALRANTGQLVWAFQTVHHDLWDYDVASPPALVKVKGQDAVAVGSKTGHLFLLDRDTGQPLFPVEERPVPASDAVGEAAAKTQPFPTLPKPLVPQQFIPWGPTPEARQACADQAARLRNEGVFTPPSVRGTLAVPGNIGGLHWGGVAFDPKQALIIAPANNIAAYVRLVPREQFAEQRRADKFGLEFAPQANTPYGMARQFLLSPAGLPCNAPPWGTLSAVDTNTGALRWQVPLGEMAGPGSGAINLGGPITTASGLTFIGATLDGFFRAFATRSGQELWKTKLPASARSTPMTFLHQGRQYVVISAGGHDPKFGPLGDEVVAFALPR